MDDVIKIQQLKHLQKTEPKIYNKFKKIHESILSDIWTNKIMNDFEEKSAPKPM